MSAAYFGIGGLQGVLKGKHKGVLVPICCPDPSGRQVAFMSDTRILLVKNPEFNDSRNILTDIKVKTMMNGDIRTRRSTPGPTKFSLEFIELSRTKALEFNDFIVSTNGTKIRYIDYEDNNWIGYITLESSVTTTGVGGGSEARKESNTIRVDFEGFKLS